MRSLLRAISPRWFRKLVIVYERGLFSSQMSPEQLSRVLDPWKIIAQDYGYARSISNHQCVDAAGSPIPWYTYPAIEQLAKWDFSAKDVLEYGSGNSTLWWSRRAKSVTSIESDEGWHDQVKRGIGQNVSLLLSPVNQQLKPQEDLDRYVGAIEGLGAFDVVIIDGEAKNHVRLQCASRALSHLRDGGLIILDNSDYLPLTCRLLRDRGFQQIDFCGLVPLNDDASTTSLFFRPDFKILPLSATHPGPAIGGAVQNWESEDWLEKWPA